MKKMLIVIAVSVGLAIVASSAFAQDWYYLDLGGFSYNQCAPGEGRLSSPAHLIELCYPYPYKILNEIKVGGKVVEVTIYDGSAQAKYTFYRLERCQQVLKARQAAERREQRHLEDLK